MSTLIVPNGRKVPRPRSTVLVSELRERLGIDPHVSVTGSCKDSAQLSLALSIFTKGRMDDAAAESAAALESPPRARVHSRRAGSALPRRSAAAQQHPAAARPGSALGPGPPGRVRRQEKVVPPPVRRRPGEGYFRRRPDPPPAVLTGLGRNAQELAIEATNMQRANDPFRFVFASHAAKFVEAAKQQELLAQAMSRRPWVRRPSTADRGEAAARWASEKIGRVLKEEPDQQALEALSTMSSPLLSESGSAFGDRFTRPFGPPSPPPARPAAFAAESAFAPPAAVRKEPASVLRKGPAAAPAQSASVVVQERKEAGAAGSESAAISASAVLEKFRLPGAVRRRSVSASPQKPELRRVNSRFASNKSFRRRSTMRSAETFSDDDDEDDAADGPSFLKRLRGAAKVVGQRSQQQKANVAEARKRKLPFTDEEYMEMRRHFERIDVDRGGTLSFSEVQGLNRYLGRRRSITQTDFKKIDRDRSGAVDFAEVLVMLYPKLPRKDALWAVQAFGPPHRREDSSPSKKVHADAWRDQYDPWTLSEMEELFMFFSTDGTVVTRSDLQSLSKKQRGRLPVITEADVDGCFKRRQRGLKLKEFVKLMADQGAPRRDQGGQQMQYSYTKPVTLPESLLSC